MKKALIITIHPKWFKKIKDGEKDLEFRGYSIPKGTKVYLRETLGKRYKGFIGYNGVKYDTEYEGTGKIVAEFVVGECWIAYEHLSNGSTVFKSNHKQMCLNSEALNMMGYRKQLYAIKIKDLIVYDEEWITNQLWTTETHFDVKSINNIPKKPIHWNEFISWNKVQKSIKSSYGVDEKNCDGLEDLYIDTLYEHIDFINETMKKDNIDMNIFSKNYLLTKPNQGKVWVVAKEW